MNEIQLKNYFKGMNLKPSQYKNLKDSYSLTIFHLQSLRDQFNEKIKFYECLLSYVSKMIQQTSK